MASDYALSITEAKTSLKKCRQALGLHRQAPAAAPAAVGPSFKLPEVKVPVFPANYAFEKDLLNERYGTKRNSPQNTWAAVRSTPVQIETRSKRYVLPS